MKLAELKKLKDEKLLEAAVNLHKELGTLKKNSVAKDKYEEALSLNSTLTQDKQSLEDELSSLKETTVSKEVFNQKVQEATDLIQDKENLELQLENLTNASIETTSQSTHFLIPGMLGEDLVDLIRESIFKKFTGEAVIAVFGNDDTPMVESLLKTLEKETIPEEFVLITNPCVAINPFSMIDLRLLKCKKNGDFNTGLPIVLEREKLDNFEDFESIEELINAYHAVHSGGQVPLRILDVGPDNMKCGVYRTNPRMDIVEDALVSKKFYCFNEKGIQALQPILEELYPTAEEEE